MRLVCVLLGLLSVGFCQGIVRGETWSERLGYAAEDKVIILNVNYLGSAYEFNGPSQELLEKGLVQSASVMPPCPWFEGFATWRRGHLSHDVGVCLTFNSPSKACRWGPASNADDVPSLVDADGYLWHSEVQFAVRADVDDVKREIHRQIEKARSAGIRPSHLTPFLGTLLTRSDVLEAYLQAAEKYWIPAVIVELTPEKIEIFRREGFPLSDEMIDLVGRYRLPKLDAIEFIPDAGNYEEKRSQFFQMIEDLPPGLTQIVAGAAADSPGLRQLTADWQNRVWDRRLLADPQVREFFDTQPLVFTNWKEVMRRFEGQSAPTEASKPRATELDAPGEPAR